MRYGGYDLCKASKKQTCSFNNIGSFRLKRRFHNTARIIVDRFNNKFGDSIKHINAQRSMCDSPISFQGSLFEPNSLRSSKLHLRYNPKDLRTQFELSKSAKADNYIFGTSLLNFASRNELTGKSSIKMINTLQEIGVCKSENSNSENYSENFKNIQNLDTLTLSDSSKSSLQRLKDERKTIFKELIELSSCDESLEYRLVKDYLECNTYSEIENDSEFKYYLQRKNYNDILDYLADAEPKSLMSISSSIARAQSALEKNALNNSKKLSTPKALHGAKATPIELYTPVCNSCRSYVYSGISNEQNTPNFNEHELSAPNLRRFKTTNLKPESKTNNKFNLFTNSYHEVLKFCHEFFEDSFGKHGHYDLPKFATCTKFSEQRYDRIIKDFITAQGFQDVEQYVNEKFGNFISNQLMTFCKDFSSVHENKGYCDQMQSEEMMHLVPTSLQGKEDILFGNLHELYTFHNEIFLKDLENCISTTELVALCFVQRRDTFYRLYSFYCQNIPRSERLRETLVDTHLFLQECQKRLGHKLPLGAYLLKPVQRITKYQLLLKDLLRFSDSGNCTKELQKALDCMLIVLKCVNDSMHQVAISGFPTDLSQQGELLLQDSFQIWTESKKDIRLRIKPQQRHIFLYQKSMLFCKQTSKPGHNKSTYQFKHHLKMSQIGLTESVRGDTKRFEVWLQGRQEVHTLQAPTLEIKNKWVAEIKRVLLNQLEELKGEKIKQYGLCHRGLKQTTSWDTPNILLGGTTQRTISCDASSESSNRNSNCSGSSGDDNCSGSGINITATTLPNLSNTTTNSNNTTNNLIEKDPQQQQQHEAYGWSSDCSNSEDEMSIIEDNSTPGSKFLVLADYVAMGHSEVSMREGDTVELLKVGCAGWWFVRVLDTNAEGWTPAAYLESINRKSSRSSSRNQERANSIRTTE